MPINEQSKCINRRKTDNIVVKWIMKNSKRQTAVYKIHLKQTRTPTKFFGYIMW